MEQRFALVDDQICDKIYIPKSTHVLHIPTVYLAKVFFSYLAFVSLQQVLKVQSLKGLNSGLNLKTLLEAHYSLFCVGGVLVVVSLFVLFVCLLAFV